MMMIPPMMRPSDPRATGKEIAIHVYGLDPTSSAGNHMVGHEKESATPIFSSPATVRPNVKQINMPWKTQHDFFVSGSGEPQQGVSLASRALGEEGAPSNAEFLKVVRSKGVSIPIPQVSCSDRVDFNPPDFAGLPQAHRISGRRRSHFSTLKTLLDTTQ